MTPCQIQINRERLRLLSLSRDIDRALEAPEPDLAHVTEMMREIRRTRRMIRGLKGEISSLTEKNTELSGNLASTKSELVQAQADLETVKTDLVTAQQENEKRKAEVDRLKSQLNED